MNWLAPIALCCVPLAAETLNYSLNWPSGLSLGEASLKSNRAEAWAFEMEIDASVPGFAIRDTYRSSASSDLCSEQLDKTVAHGSRTSQERIVFDQHKNVATRQTLPVGGKSEIPVPRCARDPLTFLQFVRNELTQGRLAPQQPVVFGALYDIRLEVLGTQQIRVGDERKETDRIQATLKGPVTALTFELYFTRDAARTPVMAKLPLPLGTFTVELIR